MLTSGRKQRIKRVPFFALPRVNDCSFLLARRAAPTLPPYNEPKNHTVMNPPNCRFCQSPLATTMADLGIASPPKQLPQAETDTATQRSQALNVFICDRCFLVQSPSHRLDRPFFVSDESDFGLSSRQTRASHYADMMIDRFGLTPENLVIQHDDRDGNLLPNFQRANIPVLGIQPYPHITETGPDDIPSISERFGGDVAERLTAENKQADLFISHHSLDHVSDLNDFVLGIQTVLKPDGVFTIEFPHLLQQMQQAPHPHSPQRTTIYFSFLTVEKIFSQHGLTLFDVEEIPAHGGSLRLFGRHDAHGAFAVTPEIKALRDREKAAGLDKLETYQNLGQAPNDQN